ncbi:ATP-binding protein [Pontibacterium granulatum]|uniref:ATP-binding protein n=1 Tax=Pontibacterium granulatum TaxID=2036029 RepID=UPI00249C896F|nr:ATP-binding protein [Pontibacterium granulatum]MDI3324901.1 ATP-binding protein [Pontibacterium granulatum]
MKHRQKLGIRGRFFLAFGALSALTLLASIISWVSYNRLGNELNQVVEGNIQTLGLMANLKEQGTKITLLAPTLLAAEDTDRRQKIWEELKFNLDTISYLLPAIAGSTQDPHAETALAAQIDIFKATLSQLDSNVLKKFEIQQQKQSENQRLRWIASSFLSEIDTLTENAQRDLHSYYNQDLPDSWIVINNYGQETTTKKNADLQRLYRIKADVNLLVNLVDRAQHLPDLNSLIATQTHSDEITQRIKQDIEAINTMPGIQALRQTIVNIVFLTRGENNMFLIRSRERSILRSGELLLEQMRQELNSLNELIAIQTAKAETAARSSVANAEETIQKARFWMLMMVAASLLFSILIVWLYVGRYMVARITSLDKSMRSIANGNLEEQVQVKGDDEITTMARSLISFRDQLTTLQEELVQAGKMAAMGQLSAGIAHEINQPLSAIGHYSHNGVRLLNAGRIEDTEKNLNQISHLTKRATTIITRLKALARNQPLNLTPVDLDRVINNVLHMLEGDEIRKQTTINVHYQHAENQVQADPVQLEQVVMNLVTNALDAVREQEEKLINIECLHRHDMIEIYVRDSGPGIDQELREQIFEPFFTTKRRGQSLGLGLAISFNIIKNFGGKLTVDENAGGGASFCIQLPEHRSSK